MNTTDYPKFKNMNPQLLVTDLSRSVEFYSKMLGFQVSFCYEDFYCGITKDNHSIHLKQVHATISAANKDGENLDLLFSVEEIERLYKDLKAGEATIIQPLRTMPYGREFYIADPDKHIIAFVEENNS